MFHNRIHFIENPEAHPLQMMEEVRNQLQKFATEKSLPLKIIDEAFKRICCTCLSFNAGKVKLGFIVTAFHSKHDEIAQNNEISNGFQSETNLKITTLDVEGEFKKCK